MTKYLLIDLASDHWRHQPRDGKGRWTDTGAGAAHLAEKAVKGLSSEAKRAQAKERVRKGPTPAKSAPAESPAAKKSTSRLDSLVSTYAHSVEERAKQAEPRITRDLQSASRGQGQLEGLKYRLKEHGSLSRKIKADTLEEFGGDVRKASANIKDAVRYTLMLDESNANKGAQATLDALRAKGHKPSKIKNFFKPPHGPGGYRGVNIQMVDPDGHPWELQFHTQASFDAKMKGGHEIYEAWRVLDPDSPEAKRLWEKSLEHYRNSVPTPPGIEALG